MKRVEDLTQEDIMKIAKEIMPAVVRSWIKGLLEMDRSFKEADVSLRALSVSMEEDRRFSHRQRFAARHAHTFAEACK